MPSLSERVKRDQSEAARDHSRKAALARWRVDRSLSGPSRVRIRSVGSRTRIRIRPARARGISDLIVERGAGATMGMLMVLPIGALVVVLVQIFFQPSIVGLIAGGTLFVVGAIAFLAAFNEPYCGYSLVLEDGFAYVRGRGQLGYIAPLQTLEVVSPLDKEDEDASSKDPDCYIRYKPTSVRNQGFSVRLNRDDTVRLRECISESLRSAPEINTDRLPPAKPQKTWADSLLWAVILGCGALCAYVWWSA